MKWVGNRLGEISLGRNDRLGFGTSKIEVLAKQSWNKTRNINDLFRFPLILASAGIAKRKQLKQSRLASMGGVATGGFTVTRCR